MYRSLGAVIFPGSRRRFPARLRGTVRCRYRDEELVGLLRQMFGEQKLGEALSDLAIPCYDTESRTPRFFERRSALDSWGAGIDFHAWEVARAATAAPTYFAPAHVRCVPDTGRRFSLIDGGVFANNPSFYAYAAARKLYPEASRFLVLSLGTGITDQPYPYEEMRSWGSLDWISPGKGLPLIDMMIDGQSDGAMRILEMLPEVRLFRLNVTLDRRSAALDDADEENIEYLEERARGFAEKNGVLLEQLCGELQRRIDADRQSRACPNPRAAIRIDGSPAASEHAA